MKNNIENKIELYNRMMPSFVNVSREDIYSDFRKSLYSKLIESFLGERWLEWTQFELELIGWKCDDKIAYPPLWALPTMSRYNVLYDADGGTVRLNDVLDDLFYNELYSKAVHFSMGVCLEHLYQIEKAEQPVVRIVYGKKWMWKNMLLVKRTLISMGIPTSVRHGLTYSEYYDLKGLERLDPVVALGVKQFVAGTSLLCRANIIDPVKPSENDNQA